MVLQNKGFPEGTTDVRVTSKQIAKAVDKALRYMSVKDLAELSGIDNVKLSHIRQRGISDRQFSTLNRLLSTGLFEPDEIFAAFDKNGKKLN